jgi:hypothetical protein
VARRDSGLGPTDNRVRVSGVSASPPPPSPPVPGYAGWWDAARITGQADDTALASWPDLSGDGFNWAQATGAHRPTYYKTTSAKLVNGLPAVWFNGSSTFMQTTGPTYTSANTVFLVGSGATGTSEYVTSSSDTFGAGPAIIYGFTAGELQYYNQLTGHTADEQTFGTGLGGATWGACWVQTDGVQLTGFLHGGSSVFNVVPNNAISGISNKYLGCAAGSANFYSGAVCEMLVYLTGLSLGNVDSTLAYLASKWGS